MYENRKSRFVLKIRSKFEIGQPSGQSGTFSWWSRMSWGIKAIFFIQIFRIEKKFLHKEAKNKIHIFGRFIFKQFYFFEVMAKTEIILDFFEAENWPSRENQPAKKRGRIWSANGPSKTPLSGSKRLVPKIFMASKPWEDIQIISATVVNWTSSNF